MGWNRIEKNEWTSYPYQILGISRMAHLKIVQPEKVSRDLQGHRTIWEYANEHRHMVSKTGCQNPLCSMGPLLESLLIQALNQAGSILVLAPSKDQRV